MRSSLFFLFFLSTFAVYAQDLVVTLDGDSLNCKITKIRQDHIFFTYVVDSKPVNTLIPMQKVSYYETDYYQEKIELPNVRNYLKHPSLTFSLNGGYTYRLARIDPSTDAFTKDYYKGLKSGYNYGADLTYYFYESLGAGIKFTSAGFYNKVSDVIVTFNNGTVKYGDVSDHIVINFIGPSVTTRYFPNDNENCMTMGGAIGYMTYRDNSIVVDPVKITGNTFGVAMDFGYDFEIGPTTNLGLKFSYITGFLFKVNIEEAGTTRVMELDDGTFESLGRFDIGVILRYSF